MDQIWQFLVDKPEVATALAALASAIAAAVAAVVAFFAPLMAAKKSERLRREAETLQETRRLKMYILNVLMRERGRLWSTEAVGALNLIDLVFNKSSEVRDAWAELYSGYDMTKQVPHHAQSERLRRLLREIARDLRITDHLALADFERIYFPNAMAEEARIAELQRAQALAELVRQGTSPSANTSTTITSSAPSPMWPPRPGQ